MRSPARRLVPGALTTLAVAGSLAAASGTALAGITTFRTPTGKISCGY